MKRKGEITRLVQKRAGWEYAAFTIVSQNSYILYSIYFRSRRETFRTLRGELGGKSGKKQ